MTGFVGRLSPVAGSWREDHTCEFAVELNTTGDVSSILAAEAKSLIPAATVFTSTGTTSNDDGSVTSDSRFGFVPAGPLFQAIHESRPMVEFLEDCTGITGLRPWRAGYNVYRTGDHLGAHRDARRAVVTIVLALTDDLPEMRWAPALIDAEAAVIGQLHRAELPESEGIALPVPRKHLRAFDGSRVPHWRDPFPFELGLLATCSYTAEVDPDAPGG